MPGFDKTGPTGRGPMTGRRMGQCTNFGKTRGWRVPSPEMNEFEPFFMPSGGRGYGCGRGLNRYGMGCQYQFRGGR